ncbi:putative MFS family arabinose efflux permease [Acinetobacter calcoaceticus]|uniref:Putative MFS family arabinose efflux permease n=1 Tax=Acinetobacter calcoaceticus TaxID=471 RepID=A0A4R1XEH2_ACICA|nr:putative MFS family arabinose efflux permease [Acinetobacter calcoaceticus]
MTNPYAELFKTSGTLAFTLSGLVARLALPMIGIGIITMLVQQGYGYGFAGAVSAVFVLSYALISPQVARLVDLYGQSKILLISGLLSALGLISLAAHASLNLADWSLFVAAVLAGFLPSISAMVRARWTMIYRGKAQLQQAYSLESVLDEVTFILGPPISVGLSVAWFNQAGIVTAALMLLIGVVIFSQQKSTEPPIHRLMSTASPAQSNEQRHSHRHSPSKSVISLGKVQLLAALMLAMGLIVGTIDIASVAFAQQQGTPIAASLVLSAYAVSSCLAGLVFGAIKFKRSLHQMLLWAAIATAVTTLPMLLITHVYALTAAVFIAGLAFSPSLILAMSMAERVVPEQQLTEALTWLLAGLNVGVAMGAACSGQIVELYNSARAGFLVSLIAALLLVIVAGIIFKVSSKEETQPKLN